MKKFKYENDGGHVHIVAVDMDMQDLAVEIGVIVQNLHSRLMQQEPRAAKQFQLAVMMSIMPGSPVWNVEDLSEGGSCTMVMGVK